MFAQVIQGRVRDGEALRRQFDRWDEELKPGAAGYLGGTAGVADDGQFIAVARFESEEAARANSDRPEQGQWWEETAGLFEGDVTFHDCREVDLFLGGGSDDAGFVQVIQGRGDRDQMRQGREEMEAFLRRVRPDVLGGLVAWHDGGSFTQVVYFVDEESARESESQEPSPEDAEQRDRYVGSLQDVSFIDLHEPWLSSA